VTKGGGPGPCKGTGSEVGHGYPARRGGHFADRVARKAVTYCPECAEREFGSHESPQPRLSLEAPPCRDLLPARWRDEVPEDDRSSASTLDEPATKPSAMRLSE
jgi:hypothetical protein